MNAEQDSYYGRSECSNSDLSVLNKYWESFQIIYDIIQVQNFGTLLDCMITELSRVDFYKLTCAGVVHPRSEFALAEAMKKVFFANEFCRLLHANSDMQKVTVNKAFKITYQGFTFYLPFRMKADFNAVRILKMIADLKTTKATTEKEFRKMIRAFGYHRQAAVYMDMEGIDKFVIIGISKIAPHRIFMVTIQRGDELYNEGRAAYEELAFKHWTLFYSLKLAA